MKVNIFRISALCLVVVLITSGFTFAKKVDLSRYKATDIEVCYYVPNQDEIPSNLTYDATNYLFLGNSFIT